MVTKDVALLMKCIVEHDNKMLALWLVQKETGLNIEAIIAILKNPIYNSYFACTEKDGDTIVWLNDEGRKAYAEHLVDKENKRHNYRVAAFSAISGGVAGFIVSLVFWLLTGEQQP